MALENGGAFSGTFYGTGYGPGGALAGNGTEGTFLPFQLWAGESDITTTDEVIAQLGPLPFGLVMGRRADGNLVPLVYDVNDAGGLVAATGTVTFTANPAVNDTLTIAGTVITFIANNANPVGNQVPLGANDTATAQAVAEFIQQNPTIFTTVSVEYNFDAAPLVLEIEANTPGTGGNAITLAKSSTAITLSGATLTGGSATTAERAPESRAVAVLAQPIDTTAGDTEGPVYLAGVFNHMALVWPPGVTTLAQKKALTDGAKFSVKALK